MAVPCTDEASHDTQSLTCQSQFPGVSAEGSIREGHSGAEFSRLAFLDMVFSGFPGVAECLCVVRMNSQTGLSEIKYVRERCRVCT